MNNMLMNEENLQMHAEICRPFKPNQTGNSKQAPDGKKSVNEITSLTEFVKQPFRSTLRP
jgi:hypothetical protein